MNRINENPISDFKEVEKEIENYKYVILSASDLITLTKSVTGLIEMGWKPLGGMVPQGNWDKYYQTMIKE